MIGGIKIMPWRQCNAVSPAVTATQTGPGTHNGMALAVSTLTGSNITINGPQYQSVLNLGTAGSNNAASPAGVTLTPQATGSLIYGAVNRNDAATAWTPDSNTAFHQNITDTTNTAAYGTFFGGAAPITASHVKDAFLQQIGSTTALTASIASTGGNTLVAYVLAFCNASTPTFALSNITDSAGNTWMFSTAAQSQTPPSAGAYNGLFNMFEFTAIGYCINAAAVTSVTVTCNQAATNSLYIAVSEFSGIPSGSTVISAANSTVTNATTLTTPALTPGSTPYVAVAVASGVNNWTSASAPWTMFDSNGTSGSWLVSSATGAQSVTWTLAAGNNSCGSCILAFYQAGAFTTANVSVTVGASNGPAGANGGVAACEIMAAPGYVLAGDASSPAPVSATSATSVTTAHFTPPMGSLLLAQVATAGTNVGVQVTDDNGMLAWVELARWASGTSGYAGVWAAVVVCG